MRIIVLSLLVAVTLIATSVRSQAIFEAGAMGRYNWSVTGGIQFDHPGFVFGLQWMGGLTRISAVMSVVHTNSTTPGYQPHRFGAFLFAGYGSEPLSRPPPLDQSIATMNFTTATWASGAATTVVLFDGLDESIAWSVFVIKMTEADWNQAYFDPNFVTFHRYETTSSQSELSQHILPIARVRGRVTQQQQRRRRIEFVGDSITAGYCNLCDKDNTFASEDFALTWGYRTAEHFDAEYHVAAWSGYGVIRNCNGGDIFMPEIFQRTLATVDEQTWDFSAWVPDILVVNLGTNDHLDAAHPGTFEHEWVLRFAAFLNHTVTERYPVEVRGNEGKTLSIYVACGPMQSAAQCIFANQSLALLKPDVSDKTKFHFLNFAGALQNDDTCCGHPSGTMGDVILANITVARIVETEGWSTPKRYRSIV